MKKIIAAFALAAGLIMAPVAAHATEPTTDETPYVLVAWTMPGGADSVWDPPQEYFTSTDLAEPTLDALDGDLLCGTAYQIDLYWDDEGTRALIEGGVLYGPSDPYENLAYVLDGDPWKIVTTEDCVEPEPTPEPEPETLAATGIKVNTPLVIVVVVIFVGGVVFIMVGSRP